MKSVHNRIAVLRAERGLSRADLADALDINFQTIGYLERGDFNPSLELAFKISEYFGLPIEAIFSRKPFRPMSEEIYGKRDSVSKKHTEVNQEKKPCHKIPRFSASQWFPERDVAGWLFSAMQLFRS